MRVLLVHNPSAGAGEASADRLAGVIRDAGYEVRAVPKDDLPDALGRSADLVAVAGGDGTVAAVLAHLPASGPPVAILPLGTANNIAASLGIAGRPEEVVATWPAASQRRFDLWQATGPWGRRVIVEGCGLGVVTQAAAAMSRHDTSATKPLDEIAEAKRVLDELTRRGRCVAVTAEIDGAVVRGDFTLFEILNVGRVGPGVTLAPDADPGDGLLNVVSRTAADAPIALRTCERVRLTWRGGRLRLDDEFRPDLDEDDADAAGELELAHAGRFATVLLPNPGP